MVKYYNNGSGRGSVWLERDVRDVEVAGSNPVAPTKIKENKNDEGERNIKLQELVGKLVGVVIHEVTDRTLFGKLTSCL